MPLHKNKILVSSVVYVITLIVFALLFGLWHNTQLKNGTDNYGLFITLLFMAVASLSWFYFFLFKISKEEINENVPSNTVEEIAPETTDEVEVKAEETFDKGAFISAIIPSSNKPLNSYCEEILHNMAKKLNVVQGLFYLRPKDEEIFEPIARYAYYSDTEPPVFKTGETLPGQAVKDKRVITINQIPENYIPVVSGLGSSKPKNLIMIPVLAGNEAIGLIELAVFTNTDLKMENVFKELGGMIGKNLLKLMN